MKSNKKYLLISCLSFFLLSSTIVVIAKEDQVDSSVSRSTNESNTFMPSLSYITHSTIEISSDLEFDVAHGVSSGTGTILDPLIIEGWNITTTEGNGIYIHDTSAYFIIRNCWIDAEQEGTFLDFNSSIRLENVADGTAKIANNTCLNSFAGISLFYSSSIYLINNTCTNSNNGIYLRSSNSSYLLSNNCTDNEYYASL